MRKLYSLMLVAVICITSIISNIVLTPVHASAEEKNFYGLNDPELLAYVEDQVYANMESIFANDDYVVEDIQTVYISKEYLEELEYNSLENIYFGYSLQEVCEQFEGTKFVFTLGENGLTEVQEFETYDDSFEHVIRNVAIGTGVIVICVTVSVATAGTGTPAVISTVFATSAKSATIAAASSGAISGVMAGIVTGMETKDFDEAIKKAAAVGSEGFKWGAITGAVSAPASKVFKVPSVVPNVSIASDDVFSFADDAVNVTDDMINNATNMWRKSELKALKKYGGSEQVSFLGGKRVARQTPGATRPDIVRKIDDHLEAIEVKNWDLTENLSGLCGELKRQIGQRIQDLPKNSTQRIVLDVEERGYTAEIIDESVKIIQDFLSDIYPNIPIDLL